MCRGPLGNISASKLTAIGRIAHHLQMNLGQPETQEAGRRLKDPPEPRAQPQKPVGTGDACCPNTGTSETGMVAPGHSHPAPREGAQPRQVSAPGRGGSAPEASPKSSNSASPRGKSGNDPLLRAESCVPGPPCSSPRPVHLWTALSPTGTISVLTRPGRLCEKGQGAGVSPARLCWRPSYSCGGGDSMPSGDELKHIRHPFRRRPAGREARCCLTPARLEPHQLQEPRTLGRSCGGWRGLPQPKQSPGPRCPGAWSTLSPRPR